MCVPGSGRRIPVHPRAEKSRSSVKSPAIAAGAGVGAEKFVTEVAVTMFDVHEVEAQLPGQQRGTMEVVNDSFYFRVRQDGKVSRQPQPPVQERAVIENTRLGSAVPLRAPSAAKIRQAQTSQP